MKKIFLSSSFKDVIDLFEINIHKNLQGKSVTFIPTASIPEKINFYVDEAKEAFENLGIKVDMLEFSIASENEIKSKLEKNDYIYVSGGNCFYLLQELKKTNADKLILEQINLGKLYIGESAGAVITSPNIEYLKSMDDYKKAKDLENFDALNLVDFYILPHYGDFPFEEVTKQIKLEYKEKLSLYPITNIQAILINNEEVTILEKK